MNLYELIFLLFICFAISCKQQESVQTKLYTDDGMEVLNGSIQQVFSGDSITKLGEYHRYDFDKNGDMKSSEKKSIGITSMEGKTDTDISVDRRKYVVNRNKKGFVTIIKYGGSVSSNIYPIPNYSNRLVFDKVGHLFTDGDPSDSIAHVIHYQCDTMGFVLKSTMIFGQTATEPIINKYKYDRNHMLIETNLYEGTLLNKTIFEYKDFDSHHNWIKKICRWRRFSPGQEGNGEYIVTRKITYY